MPRPFRLAPLVLVALTSTAPRSEASIIFTPGNNPTFDVVNINGGPGTATDAGSLVTGVTVSNTGGVLVHFTSPTDTLFGIGGQGGIQAADGAINSLTVTVPGGDFAKLIFDPQLGQLPDHTAQVTVVGSLTGSSTFDLNLGNGNNFLTVEAFGERLLSVTITSGIGFETFKQPRIDGARFDDHENPGGSPDRLTTSTPEPATLAVFGALAGVCALGCRGRRKVA